MKLHSILTMALAVVILPTAAWSAQPAADQLGAHIATEIVPVTINNYVRAETAAQFDRIVRMSGGINKLERFRQPTPLDRQSVIRMNRDTLYSFGIVDISEGAKLTLPETGGRYNSAMIVNEDGYINNVYYEPGVYDLTKKEFDTDYVLVAFRTLVDSSDPVDIKAANDLQDQFKIEAMSSKPYTHPAYDQKSYGEIRDLLLSLSKYLPDSAGAFGSVESTQQVPHLLGSAFGWGGLPTTDAFYVPVEPRLPVGTYHINVPKDVPVKAFWSISVYNKDGFFEQNDKGTYNINSQSGTRNADGSMTVNLGGCDDPSRVNCVPLTEGWNYTIRLYRPDASIVSGDWTFPKVQKSE